MPLCASCLPESKALARIDQQQPGKVAVLAVNADPTDPLATLQSFIHEAGDPGYAFVQDQGGKIVAACGASTLDTTVVLDAAGKVVYRNTVPVDEPTLPGALAQAGLR